MNLNNFSKYNIDNRGDLLSIELEKLFLERQQNQDCLYIEVIKKFMLN